MKKTRTTKPAATTSGPETEATPALLEAAEVLDATAAAFVAVLRERVADLMDALGRAEFGHPDDADAALALRTVIDRQALGAFRTAIETAEGLVDSLLCPNVLATVPDLARAARGVVAARTGRQTATGE